MSIDSMDQPAGPACRCVPGRTRKHDRRDGRDSAVDPLPPHSEGAPAWECGAEGLPCQGGPRGSGRNTPRGAAGGDGRRLARGVEAALHGGLPWGCQHAARRLAALC